MADLEELKAYCSEKNRVCPYPIYWNEMYELIVGRMKTDLPVPLILAGWWMSDDEQKSSRVQMHLDYAARNGTLDEVDRYIRGLTDDQWYVGEYATYNDEDITTSHKARIKFQYSLKQNRSHRVITSVTTEVYGNTESAALQKLREMYRSWTDFVIIEIDWQS